MPTYTHRHKCTSLKYERTKLQWELKGSLAVTVSLCGSWAGHEVPLEAVITKTRSECSFMSSGSGHHQQYHKYHYHYHYMLERLFKSQQQQSVNRIPCKMMQYKVTISKMTVAENSTWPLGQCFLNIAHRDLCSSKWMSVFHFYCNRI